MSQTTADIPKAWRDLNPSDWTSPILIFGASGSGKSTLAQYLYRQLLTQHDRVGFLDADVGQNSFGLPSTVALALNTASVSDAAFPPEGPRRVCFVGSNTPRGYIIELLLGLYRLYLFALHSHVAALVMDTSGFVDPHYGGAHLKWAQVDLFRPCTVVAIQRERELAPLLAPLRRLPEVELVSLSAPEAAHDRSRETRRAYRADCYRAYFEAAERRPVPYANVAVFPAPHFEPGRLIALEDPVGFVLALGIVERVGDDAIVWVKTPWSGEGRIAALRLGGLTIDEATYQDTQTRVDFPSA
jgi:polynucleotide 5'-kinase involved in rRNA processing